jgi:hypothetical protein
MKKVSFELAGSKRIKSVEKESRRGPGSRTRFDTRTSVRNFRIIVFSYGISATWSLTSMQLFYVKHELKLKNEKKRQKYLKVAKKGAMLLIR